MAWGFVDAVAGGSASGNTTQTLAAQNVTTGNNLVVFITWEDAARTPTVTDTAGNTYSYGTVRNQGGQSYGRIAYSLNVTGHATNVVSINYGSFTNYTQGVCCQYSDGGTPSYVTENWGGSSGTTPTSGALSMSSGDLVCCGLKSYTTGTWTAGTGYTIGTGATRSDGSQQIAIEHDLSTGTSETPSGTYSASASCIAVAIGFTEGGGGGGPAAAVFHMHRTQMGMA